MKLTQQVTKEESTDVLSEKELNAAELTIKFKNLVKEKVKREGVEELLNYLDSTDFFEAPASTRYHLCEDGGLVQHSLNVYENLVKVIEFLKTFDSNIEVNEESIVLTALFHENGNKFLYITIVKTLMKLDMVQVLHYCFNNTLN